MKMTSLPSEAWGFIMFAGFIAAVHAFVKYFPWPRPKETSKIAAALSSVGPVEDYAPNQGQTSCDPTPKLGTKLFRDWVIQHYGGYDAGIPRECSIGGTSEHKEGRAWDWGILAYRGVQAVPKETIEGLLADLLANDAELARRSGIQYMIFNRRIWTAARHGEGWRDYKGASPHTDHVHFTFSWAAARAETSFYRGLQGGVIA